MPWTDVGGAGGPRREGCLSPAVGMERQRAGNVTENVATHQQDNRDVFDDENEIDTPTSAEFSVGDGFRTGSEASPGSRPQRTSRNHSFQGHATLDAKVAPTPSRSSTYKSREAFGGSSSSNAPLGTSASNQNAPFTRADRPPRSSSRASSTYAPTERTSSVHQQAGPSFPYGLYQQSSTTRSPSVATTSVAGASIAPSTSQRPTHPYALYSQNGLDEGAAAASPLQQSIPLGFPGRGDGFHRQIGPDGEEQDIVGPDGHTEQLPPYSRYPEDGVPKITVPPTNPFQDPPTQDASPVSPQQQTSSQVLVSDAARNEAGEISEKSWNEKTWKEKRRTKICGGRLPCWIVTFMAVTAVLIAGLVAGLVGGMVKEAESKAQYV